MSQYIPLTLETRPRTFSDLAGQDITAKILKNMVKTGRIPSGVMLSGPAGTGKTTTARILSKAINCEDSKDGEPCMKCPTCTRIEEGKESDFLEIDGASNRGIKSIQAIREWAQYQAAIKYRTVIIDEVHMLTNEASNSLLKLLEEAALHNVFFIMATTEVHNVIATILSRCQVFYFKTISKEALVNRLKYIVSIKYSDLQVEESVYSLLYDRHGGGVRDSISDLDLLISYSDQTLISEDMFYEVFSVIRQSFYEELILDLVNKRLTKVFNAIDSVRSGLSDLNVFINGL